MTDSTAQIVLGAVDDTAVPPALVSELVKLFAKAVRAHQLYLPNNPMYVRALDALKGAFERVWEYSESIRLTITESQFQYEEHVVLEEASRGGDSLPWLFYKDGVRLLGMHTGFETQDLPVLLDVLHRARRRAEDGDDLVTLFWECEFTHFQYEYVEMVTEGHPAAPGAELLNGGGRGGTILSPLQAEKTDAAASGRFVGGAVHALADADVVDGAGEHASAFARMGDFDSTLYFLDEQEVTWLQNAIREDFERDLRPFVVASLLDTFEQETTPAVRDEICDVLDQLLLVLLSASQFKTVAYVVREVSQILARVNPLAPVHAQRLSVLTDRLSEPAVLTQLLEALESVDFAHSLSDVHSLLSQLKPVALAPMLAQLTTMQNASLRHLLEDVVSRLIAGNTSELVRLIQSDTEVVAYEAITRAGALRSTVAVMPLSQVLSGANPVLRRAATAALAQIGSAGAMHVLDRAIEDSDREIRLTAVRAIGEHRHRAAVARIERHIKERLVYETHTGEKAAFFETYAVLSGDAGIDLLDAILNPRGFFNKKSDSQTRACAVTALGKISTERASEILRHAMVDKDVVVRAAATRVLRDNA